MMTTSAAAYRATCVPTKLRGQVGLNMRYFQIESSSFDMNVILDVAFQMVRFPPWSGIFFSLLLWI